MNEEPRKPLVSFSVGGLSVSLWENDGQNGRTFKNVTIRKSFSKDGQLDHRSVSLNPSEIGCLVGLLKKMERAVMKHQAVSEDVPF